MPRNRGRWCWEEAGLRKRDKYRARNKQEVGPSRSKGCNKIIFIGKCNGLQNIKKILIHFLISNRKKVKCIIVIDM